MNPIRYRGYYYDAETGFYYLNSRYYDPEVGRFINADEQLNKDVMGCNLCAYCGNNPVTRSDNNGDSWLAFACGLVDGIVSAAAKMISNAATGKKLNEEVLGTAVGGFVGGFVFGITKNPTTASTAAAFAGAFAESAVNEASKYSATTRRWNGQSESKRVNSTNIATSIGNVGYATLFNGGTALVTGAATEVAIPSIEQTNQIKSFAASFFDDYAKNVHKQTVFQGCFDMEIDAMQNIGESISSEYLQQDDLIILYSKE